MLVCGTVPADSHFNPCGHHDGLYPATTNSKGKVVNDASGTKIEEINKLQVWIWDACPDVLEIG